MKLCNCLEFMDFVCCVAEDRIPSLSYNVSMTAEDIFGEEAWQLLSRGERRLAGKCMKQLVEDNVLPLAPVMGIHEYPLFYQRR